MNSLTKVGIAAAITALVVWGALAAKGALAAFKIDVVGYGKPNLVGTVLTIPLQIKFVNPTPLPINVDRLIADIYLNKNGGFVLAANINQPVTISSGESIQWLMPAINLQNIFGGNIFNTLAALQQALTNKALTVRSEVIAIYQGVALPKQTFTNEIPLT